MKKRKSHFGFLLLFVMGTGVGYAIAFVSGIYPSFTPLISVVIGLFVAFVVPAWQALFFNAPCLSIEISSIKRMVSDSAVVLLDDYPELASLKPLVYPNYPPAIQYS